MSEDQKFIASEAVWIWARDMERLVLQKLWWLNPPGCRSTRVSIDFFPLSGEPRNMLVCWYCGACKKTLFAVDLDGLHHEPCCEGGGMSKDYAPLSARSSASLLLDLFLLARAVPVDTAVLATWLSGLQRLHEAYVRAARREADGTT
jgi:hypothetical protein